MTGCIKKKKKKGVVTMYGMSYLNSKFNSASLHSILAFPAYTEETGMCCIQQMGMLWHTQILSTVLAHIFSAEFAS